MDENNNTGNDTGLQHTPLPYCQLYRTAITDLADLRSDELRVFLALLTIVEWNSNTVLFNEYNKKRLSEATGLKDKTLEVMVSLLSKQNYLLRIRNQLYQINPTLAFYGDEVSRKKVMESHNWKLAKKFKAKK